MKITLPRLPSLWAASLGVLLAFAHTSFAADARPTGKMAFQGFLTDAAGVARGAAAPVNITATFRLYNSPNGAINTALWAESQVVTVDKGHFSVILGEGTLVSGTPNSPDLSQYFIGDNADGRYLGVTVNNESEISPRIQFLASPYTHLARYANELVGSSGASVLKTGPGTVGINLAVNVSPATALDVGGTITGTGLNIVGNAKATTFSGNGADITNLKADAIATGTLNDARLSGNVARRDAANNFSGTVSLLNSDLNFDNGRTINAKNFGGVNENFLWPRWVDNITYMNYGGAGLNIRNNSSSPKLFINNAGSVGLSTTLPVGKLNIVEDTGSVGGIDSGTIVLDHENNGGYSSIIFRSKINRTSDHAFIRYQDNYSASPAGGENSILSIGNQNDGDDTICLVPSGNVGVGTYLPTQARFVVRGATGGFAHSGGVMWPNYGNAFGGGTGRGANNNDVNWSVYADGWIAAATFFAFSDERIKNVKGRSDSAADLQTVMNLEVTDYSYKDFVTKGNGTYKKLVAQQVEKVYPQAVNKRTDAIPDIYKPATLTNGWVSLASDLKKGDRVRLVAGNDEGVFEVLEVEKDKFRTEFKPRNENIFVYGREVKDFRTVDYEAISMLNVSATQALAKEVAALRKSEARVAELEQKVAKMSEMERELSALKKAVAQIVAARSDKAPGRTVASVGAAE
jgi:hypothetical protein